MDKIEKQSFKRPRSKNFDEEEYLPDDTPPKKYRVKEPEQKKEVEKEVILQTNFNDSPKQSPLNFYETIKEIPNVILTEEQMK